MMGPRPPEKLIQELVKVGRHFEGYLARLHLEVIVQCSDQIKQE